MRWPPYEHIFFDCDSTLTTIEGIDILAQSAGKGWRVEVLTQAAMDGQLDLEDVYAKRLQAVKPTQGQIRDIRRAYKRSVVEDVVPLIAALRAEGKQVYIISGGLLEPVREFGVFLGVQKENICAVEVTYNELSGHWWEGEDAKYLDYEIGDLTISDGKAAIVESFLAGKNGRSLLIGDGYSDLLAGRAVDLFVGFGGAIPRPKVQEKAPINIMSSSLAPLWALAAGPAAIQRLKGSEFAGLGEKARMLIENGAITFNDKQLETKFSRAFEAAFSQIDTSINGDRPEIN